MRRLSRLLALMAYSIALLVSITGCKTEPEPVVPVERPEWAKHCALNEAEEKRSWNEALKAAQAAFAAHKKRLKRTDVVTVINFDTLHHDPSTRGDHRDRLRVYDVNKGWQRIRSTWVSHATRSGSSCATEFSNAEGERFTSRGAYATHQALHKSGSYGLPALNVDGLEAGVNDAAKGRLIKFHKAQKKNGDKLDTSDGCFMTRPAQNEALTKQIVGGSLVYVYSSLPVVDAATRE